MPTIISHAIVGLSLGHAGKPLKPLPKSYWLVCILLPMLPDADVIAFVFGIPYAHEFGHRGFTHSLFFAVVLGFITGPTIAFMTDNKQLWLRFSITFSLLMATHGLLDALTNGGLGIALLAPFDHTRYFWPITPIDVSPIGLKAFISDWGLRVLKNEAVLIWIPSLMLIIISALIRSLFKPNQKDSR